MSVACAGAEPDGPPRTESPWGQGCLSFGNRSKNFGARSRPTREGVVPLCDDKPEYHVLNYTGAHMEIVHLHERTQHIVV